ncbi:MAG: hypothetical protein RIR97_1602, partial [Pseudomonadota bacterium]
MTMAQMNSTSSTGSSVTKGLKEGLYAGVIAFFLFVLFIGLKTDQNMQNELIIVQR